MKFRFYHRLQNILTDIFLDTGKPLVSAFVGEFGHELFCYQGRMRYLSQFFPETIIYTRAGHEYLYQDFAKVKHITATGSTAGVYCKEFEKINLEKNFIPPESEIAHYLPNRPQEWVKIEQKYISYKTDGINIDYILHARNTSKWGTKNKDWSYDNWRKLIPKLKGTIGMVGKKDSSLWLEGTLDLRDISVFSLSGMLSSCKLFIGSCSGVSHLASLCETKKLVWGEKINKQRHEVYWNPFKTDVTYLSTGYNPSVEQIYEKSNL